jgi:transposase-like protein
MATGNWIENLNKLTFVELVTRFPTEASAIEFLEAVRWPSGPSCFRCGCTEVSRVKSSRKRPLLYCTGCKQQFSITTGTVMEDTKIPLNKWLMALHLMCASKKGISSLQLHRMLGITRRSAWHLSHRIREAMTDMVAPVLRGTVEVDEAYIGGKARGKGQGFKGNKTAVVTMVERGGRAHSHVTPEVRVTGETTTSLLEEHIDQDATLNTDESSLYRIVGQHFGHHDTVNHKEKVYSRWDRKTGRRASTNTVEGYFGNLKRQLDGTHHHVDAHNLHRYVHEFEFKYNTREINDGPRMAFTVKRVEGRRLTLFMSKCGAPSLRGW